MNEQKVWTNPIGAATAKAKDFDATLSMRQNNLDMRVARVKGFRLAKRLETCYMACAGIEDPAAALEVAREAIRPLALLADAREDRDEGDLTISLPGVHGRIKIRVGDLRKARRALKLLDGMRGGR